MRQLLQKLRIRFRMKDHATGLNPQAGPLSGYLPDRLGQNRDDVFPQGAIASWLGSLRRTGRALGFSIGFAQITAPV